MEAKKIYVTKPYLPPLEDFIPYLETVWKNEILTNGGPFHQQLEKSLCEYLGVDNISLFTNGTIALITALQALGISGEVITTPYSFVATAHSLLWNGVKPIFVDIDPKTFNIDPTKIEAAITPHTTAIMPVHCYGNPCDVDSIKKIAEKHNLKVIYDAAHAFGIEDIGGSILRHGDMSVLSFHATKVFNTFEGGAIVCRNSEAKKKIDQLKNFGFVNETTVVAPGINGKMSEICAAFGMLQLKGIDEAIAERKSISNYYINALNQIAGIVCFPTNNAVKNNYSYFPILVNDSFRMTRDGLYERLKEHGIYARRYFFPMISDFPMYCGIESAQRSNLPKAALVSDSILCLPIYPGLSTVEIERIVDVIKTSAI